MTKEIVKPREALIRMNYSSRFFLYAPLAALLFTGAVFGVHWWLAATALEQRLDAMNAREAMPGVTVRFASRSVGGFPFNLDLVFEDFRVGVATGRGTATWRAEHFASHALTYGRDETIFEAAGRQSLTWSDEQRKYHRVDFQTGAAHASAILTAGSLSRFDLDLVGVGCAALTTARLQFHVRHVADGNRFDVFASGDDIRLSPALRGAFGDSLKSIALQGTVSQATAFDALRKGERDWRSAVEAWRNAPGRLRLEPLELRWANGLDMLGHGALSLDAGRRPEGIVDFKITGVAGWLARNPPMSPDGFAGALRDRAAKAGSDDGGRMGAVFGIQDSVVYVGDDPVGMAGPLY